MKMNCIIGVVVTLFVATPFLSHDKSVENYQNPNSSSIPAYAHSSGGGTAVVNNTSLGLFIEPNGTLVHITLQLEGADRHVFIEKFDSDLNLVSYGPVSNLDYQTRPEQYHVHFQAMDESGQVYFFDNRDRSSGTGITRGYIKESGTD